MKRAPRLHRTVPRRRGLVIALLAIAVGAAGAMVSTVWSRLRVIDFGYRISQATQENARLQEANRQLRVEAALLKRPDRVSRIAEETLGLRPPAPEQVRRLHAPEVQAVTSNQVRR